MNCPQCNSKEVENSFDAYDRDQKDEFVCCVCGFWWTTGFDPTPVDFEDLRPNQYAT